MSLIEDQSEEAKTVTELKLKKLKLVHEKFTEIEFKYIDGVSTIFLKY